MTFFEALVSLATATIAFLAGRYMERLKRRDAMNDIRRNAYASWFVTAEFVNRRTGIVCEKLVGFPRDRKKHAALAEEMASLAMDISKLMTAMNEAYLIEHKWRVRRKLQAINKSLLVVFDALDFAARHYGDDLEFHEEFESMPDDTFAEMPEELRARWNAVKERFKVHDATCPFKSEKFYKTLSGELKELRDETHSLRETLAGTML